MILLIEMQCKEWEHNRVNAGIIKMLHKAFLEESMKLYGEKKHIAGVQELIANECVALESHSIEFYDWRIESENHVVQYEQLMQQIIAVESYIEKIVILSCNKGIVISANRLSRQMPNVEIYIIMHAALEEVCIKVPLHERLKKIYNKVIGANISTTMKECINDCTMPNCKFIVYSPCCETELKGKLQKNVLSKFIFLHHPFYEVSREIQKCVNDKIVIGVYGQAINENARKIISLYNQRYDNNKIVFRVIKKGENSLYKENNVEKVLDKEYVSNKELESIIQQFDYILIPYANNQYRVTASGIFWDAVSQEIPVLMLNSPFFEYYSSYQIGVIKNDIESMAACLGSLSVEEKMCFEENEKKLKEVALKENIYILREKMK